MGDGAGVWTWGQELGFPSNLPGRGQQAWSRVALSRGEVFGVFPAQMNLPRAPGWVQRSAEGVRPGPLQFSHEVPPCGRPTRRKMLTGLERGTQGWASGEDGRTLDNPKKARLLGLESRWVHGSAGRVTLSREAGISVRGPVEAGLLGAADPVWRRVSQVRVLSSC